MSLINEALKKASKEKRDPKKEPLFVITHGLDVKRSQRPPLSILIAVLGRYVFGAIIVVCLMWAAIAFFIFIWKSQDSGYTAEEKLTAEDVIVEIGTPASTTPTTPKPVIKQDPAIVITHSNNSPSSTSNEIPATTPTRPPAPAEVAPPTSQVKAPDPIATAEEFLEAAQINAVKVAGDRSKLIMNNEVYRLGAMVSRTHGLRIITITRTQLEFKDESGRIYRKSLE